MTKDELDDFRRHMLGRYPVSAPGFIAFYEVRMADLTRDLKEAAATLRKYESYHRAKGTEESTAKADVNASLAARFESTIAKTASR